MFAWRDSITHSGLELLLMWSQPSEIEWFHQTIEDAELKLIYLVSINAGTCSFVMHIQYGKACSGVRWDRWFP